MSGACVAGTELKSQSAQHEFGESKSIWCASDEQLPAMFRILLNIIIIA